MIIFTYRSTEENIQQETCQRERLVKKKRSYIQSLVGENHDEEEEVSNASKGDNIRSILQTMPEHAAMENDSDESEFTFEQDPSDDACIVIKISKKGSVSPSRNP